MKQAAKAPFCEAGSLGTWGGALLKKIIKEPYRMPEPLWRSRRGGPTEES